MGVTQGFLFPPTIFNIVVDVVVRLVLLEVCGPLEAHHGLGWEEGYHNIVFYADYGRIADCNPISVQTTLTVVVSMLERVGLQKNLGKTKSMVFTPGFIWGRQGTSTYKRRASGEGGTFRKWKKQIEECRGQCQHCPSTITWKEHTG